MATLKRIRQCDELAPEWREKGERLLEIRWKLKQFEDEIKEMVKITSSQLKELLESLSIESLVSKKFGKVTLTETSYRVSYPEEALIEAMKEAKIPTKKIEKILESARKETVVKPFIQYTKNNGK